MGKLVALFYESLYDENISWVTALSQAQIVAKKAIDALNEAIDANIMDQSPE